MKKALILIVAAAVIFSASPVFASGNTLARQLAGRVLLQVESYGRAWYVDPVSLERYYLQNGDEAFAIMRSKGLGISNANLKGIPIEKGQAGNKALVNRLKGRILLQVEDNGEAWYVNPTDGLRYYMADGRAAYELMKSKGLGITNENLSQIPINRSQLVQDTTFNGYASVRYDGANFAGGQNPDQILAVASLTKLMTALVFLDTSPDWSKKIIITKEQVEYPKTLAGEDSTSEVDLSAGDQVTVYDLWVAMLVASSNQAAAALAESSGLSRKEFIDKMNQKALALGLVRTKFYDPTGLDAHNVSTAKEMAKIAYAAFSDERISQAGRLGQYMISALNANYEPKEIKVTDRNYSLQIFEPQAVKTGYLVEAQRTVTIKKNGAIIVVLHALSMKQRNEALQKLIDLQ